MVKLAKCPECNGNAEITKVSITNIHSGKHLDIFVGYCSKGLSNCFYLEMEQAVNNMDIAVMVWNVEAERKYFEQHGFWRA